MQTGLQSEMMDSGDGNQDLSSSYLTTDAQFLVHSDGEGEFDGKYKLNCLFCYIKFQVMRVLMGI